MGVISRWRLASARPSSSIGRSLIPVPPISIANVLIVQRSLTTSPFGHRDKGVAAVSRRAPRRGWGCLAGESRTTPLGGGSDLAGVGARGMRAGGFPENPGGLVVSILKTAGARAPAHHARGRGRRTWRPTERIAGARTRWLQPCAGLRPRGTAGRRQRSAGGWAARSRSVSEYRRSGGIEPTRPRGGKGAPAGGTGGGKDGQHTAVGSRLHVTTTDSRTGQTSLRDGGGHRLASWTRGYATARSEAVCRGAGCGRTRTSGSVGGQGQQRPWSTRPPETGAGCQIGHEEAFPQLSRHRPRPCALRPRCLSHGIPRRTHKP